MIAFLLADIAYGNYISPIKLAVILILFFLWLPVLGWVWLDAKAVKAKQVTWTAAIFVAGAVALIIWFLLPAFMIGTVLYIIAVGASCVGYVMHRNSLVSQYDRVLTVSHLKGLFENKEKQKASLQKGISFVTANKNEVEPLNPKHRISSALKWQRKFLRMPSGDVQAKLFFSRWARATTYFIELTDCR